MTSQFVDLFDKEKYGINYWAAIALFVGLTASWVEFALTVTYQSLVLDYGLPVPLGEFVLGSLPGALGTSVGLAVVLVALCHIMKKDLLLPVAVGVAMMVVVSVLRVTGLTSSEASYPMLLVSSFIRGAAVSGGVVLGHRLVQNKLLAVILGFVVAEMLMGVIWGVRGYLSFDQPLSIGLLVQFAVMPMPAAFLAAVLFHGGLRYHFETLGVGFTEDGLIPDGEPVGTPGVGGPLGKTRNPLVTTMLLLVTANLYAFGWIYKVYSEVRGRSAGTTSVTPGKALGLLFIPGFNAFWVAWLFVDLPRAIRRMGEQDPPSGVPLGAGIVTGVLLVSLVANLVGAFLWPAAAYLGVTLLWGGILSAQSVLNSHWRAHLGSPS